MLKPRRYHSVACRYFLQDIPLSTLTPIGLSLHRTLNILHPSIDFPLEPTPPRRLASSVVEDISDEPSNEGFHIACMPVPGLYRAADCQAEIYRLLLLLNKQGFSNIIDLVINSEQETNETHAWGRKNESAGARR